MIWRAGRAGPRLKKASDALHRVHSPTYSHKNQSFAESSRQGTERLQRTLKVFASPCGHQRVLKK